METPSQVLAKKIVHRLVAEGLLDDSDAPKLLGKLAAGKLREEDWRLPVEIAISKKDESVEAQS